jgi:hypothetical protein
LYIDEKYLVVITDCENVLYIYKTTQPAWTGIGFWKKPLRRLKSYPYTAVFLIQLMGAKMETFTSARALIRTIELGFLFEDGVAKHVPVEWSRGTTVLDALNSASHKQHGIRFRATGDGRSTFITEIDGQANDMSGNWMYWVNGDLATVGCGERVLKHGDIVSWKFVPFDPKAR